MNKFYKHFMHFKKKYFVVCILLEFGLCFGLEYLEGSCLTGQSRFTFYVIFEYIANVSLVSVCRAQLHAIMISPCWTRRVGGEHWQ